MQQLPITTTSSEQGKHNLESQTPEFSHVKLRQMQKIQVLPNERRNGVTAV
jgi:hypothetical protein